MASKLCDSCKSATATLFCRADSAFLCGSCDSKIHAANKLASRHARVWVCEVCELAPAHVTCKADAAALCVTCDRDIHSANPLAQRHERVPVTPFYDTHHRYYPDVTQEEAEAASWLLPNPKAALDSPEMNLFSDMDPYLDLDKINGPEHNSPAADGVVPVKASPIAACFELDFSAAKPFTHNFSNPSLSHSVSSSSLDVGVVPDGSAIADISNPYGPTAVPMSAMDREARVLRYREKRKNRKFEKTIRYASRKAYAETRPRIKGRFAKRTEIEDRTCGYGVVPSF